MLRLELLPADYGDCLWLEYGAPGSMRAVLIDAGPKGTYQGALRQRIERFGQEHGGKARVELFIVTHIDNDHIQGAVEFLEDQSLNVEFGEVWFNGWDQLVDADRMGVREGIALSKAIAARRIPHNTSFQGRAVRFEPGRAPITLEGGLSLQLLSPGASQLQRLRDEWEEAVAEMDSQASPPPSDLLGSPDVRALAAKPFTKDRAVANGSSIVVLAEYAGHRLLLAADAFAPVVADALSTLGYSSSRRLKLSAYKLSHHGSRANNSSDLLRMVQCRDYLFSTSGARFNHPHDECVARVLVEGGTNLVLHSNYARGDKMLWSRKSVAKEFKHTVREPAATAAGLVLEWA